MTNRPEKPFHIVVCHSFIENLIFLFCNFIEQFATVDILHDEINILFINVSLIVLYNIWMVQSGKDFDLLLNGIQMLRQFSLIEHLDRDLMVFVVYIMG